MILIIYRFNKKRGCTNADRRTESRGRSEAAVTYSNTITWKLQIIMKKLDKRIHIEAILVYLRMILWPKLITVSLIEFDLATHSTVVIFYTMMEARAKKSTLDIKETLDPSCINNHIKDSSWPSLVILEIIHALAKNINIILKSEIVTPWRATLRFSSKMMTRLL